MPPNYNQITHINDNNTNITILTKIIEVGSNFSPGWERLPHRSLKRFKDERMQISNNGISDCMSYLGVTSDSRTTGRATARNLAMSNYATGKVTVTFDSHSSSLELGDEADHIDIPYGPFHPDGNEIYWNEASLKLTVKGDSYHFSLTFENWNN